MATLFPYPPGNASTPPNTLTTATDLVDSLITYMWSRYVPAFKARGFNRQSILDVSDTIASTGYAAKVTVAQTMPSALLSDGSDRVLSDLPPVVADVVLTQDRVTAFSLSAYVEAFINGQPTLPAMVDAAMSGVINDFQEDLITTLIANVPAANIIGSYGVALGETQFIDAVSTLITNYMPNERYYALLAPTAGAYNEFMQIDRVTFAQIRRNGSGFVETSAVIADPSTYSSDIDYNGGSWSASQLVPAPTVSATVHSSNIAWHPAALAVAMRPSIIPTLGTGAVARNKIDEKTGASIQFLQQWNGTKQSEEMVVKSLYGMAPAQPQWSVLLRGA